jgi:uncharacterized MnhB-related membrane protein
MIDAGYLFDVLLASFMTWLGWRTLTGKSLFHAIVLYIAFGSTMGLAWIRLDAPDVALAEIAVGAGLTGALLLAAAGAAARFGDGDE